MTIPAIRLCALLGAALLGACATPAPLGKDFAPGARAPTASELRALLRGKSYQTPTVASGTIRVDYAADSDRLQAFYRGRSDSGTWRAEDGRICFQFQVLPSNCNEVRLLGSELYMKRSNGDVVRVTPAGGGRGRGGGPRAAAR